MAEFVMKDLVQKARREGDFYIESAATSTEEIGNEVYPPARRKLAEHGIGCKGKTARQMTRGDYQRFDLLIGMDTWNIRNMLRICGSDPEGKILVLAMLPTPGTQAILKPPGAMSSLAASASWNSCSSCSKTKHNAFFTQKTKPAG